VSVDLFERDAEGRVSSARSAPDNFRNLGVADQRSRFASVAIGDERRTMLIGVATAPYNTRGKQGMSSGAPRAQSAKKSCVLPLNATPSGMY
jgi:hypothetical protein